MLIDHQVLEDQRVVCQSAAQFSGGNGWSRGATAQQRTRVLHVDLMLELGEAAVGIVDR